MIEPTGGSTEPVEEDVLGVFVKHPIPGQVKTRLGNALGPPSGPAFAAELYAAFQADLVARLSNTGQRRVLCWTGESPAAEEYFCALAGNGWQLWRQPSGDLGERLRAFLQFADVRTRAVVVIGSDSPTLPADSVELAFRRLRQVDLVLGPATDGGYYLIGAHGTAAISSEQDVLSQIDWSSENVLQQSVSRAHTMGLRMAALPPWYDVDQPTDLAVLAGHLKLLREAEQGESWDGTETWKVLSHHMSKFELG